MTNTSILTLDGVTCTLPDGRVLFTDLNATFDHRHTGLVGANGVGKSMLGRLLAGECAPSEGRCLRRGRVHRLDQQTLRHSQTVADVAQITPHLLALQRIAQGSVEQADFDLVGERWSLAEQFQAHLARQGLGGIDPRSPASTLSPGQAMRVAIVGAFLADADYLILDEPSNHLDRQGREHLHTLIGQWTRGLLLISHNRTLLEPMQRTLHLSPLGLRSYSGGYSAYRRATLAEQAQAQDTLDRLKLQRQREKAQVQHQRERLERQQARGRGMARDANQAKILLDRQQQRSQVTAGKQLRSQQHAQQAIDQRVSEAAQRIEHGSGITLPAPAAQRPGRLSLVCLEGVQLPYGSQAPLDLHLRAGERVAVIGANGSGKSTLLKLISGQLTPSAGTVQVSGTVGLLDQHASQLTSRQSALDHLQQANPSLEVSTLRTRLAQVGLDAARVDLPSALLSGGERVKAALVALLYRHTPIDLLLLDEPGNHLDLASLEAIEQMLARFQGGVLVVSHDEAFLSRLRLDHRWVL
ncbi:ATP-binding cassette domain-containing protein [Pseudomonas sp.]|uniref:ABC-F family ATP-binding cassette domain-containing protein n=1 Tax=Pseudomonas sp. TaxID=306 RepID=UPI0028B224F6|nr:ATP-binding cassette domain-containing protein [Pseudomonas sp.]